MIKYMLLEVGLRTGRSKASVVLALIALSVLAASCTRESEYQIEADSPGAGQKSKSVGQQSVLDLGEVEVIYSHGLLSLTSNKASLVLVLKKISEVAGFDLALNITNSPSVTMQISTTDINQALSELLVGFSYQIRYEHDLNGNGHHLTRLRVGNGGLEAIAMGQQPLPVIREVDLELENFSTSDDENDDLPPIELASDEGLQYRIQEAIATDLTEQTITLQNLDAWMGDGRTEALSSIAPTGDGLRVLSTILAQDLDPAARAVAAFKLAGSDGYSAKKALIGALGDSDARVVSMAAESLVSIGDRSVITELERALDTMSNSQTQSVLQAAIQELKFSVRMDSDALDLEYRDRAEVGALQQ